MIQFMNRPSALAGRPLALRALPARNKEASLAAAAAAGCGTRVGGRSRMAARITWGALFYNGPCAAPTRPPVSRSLSRSRSRSRRRRRRRHLSRANCARCLTGGGPAQNAQKALRAPPKGRACPARALGRLSH